MPEASETAVAVAADMLGELVEKMPLEGDDPLRAELADSRPEPVEAPTEASGQEAAVAQEDEQETVELPTFEVELPEDLEAELDAPDFEAEAEAEVIDDGEEYVEGYEVDSEERRKRIAAEKKAAWLEGRLAETNRSKWEAEAKKYFPLSEHALANIKADSRRAFLREARTAHQAVLPYVKPLVDKLAEAEAAVKAQAKADGRQEAQAAWGTPTSGPGSAPVAASARNEELDAARRSGNLAKVIGIMRQQAGG